MERLDDLRAVVVDNAMSIGGGTFHMSALGNKIWLAIRGMLNDYAEKKAKVAYDSGYAAGYDRGRADAARDQYN